MEVKKEYRLSPTIFLIYILGNIEDCLKEEYNVRTILTLIVILLLVYSNKIFLLTRNAFHLDKKLKFCKYFCTNFAMTVNNGKKKDNNHQV